MQHGRHRASTRPRAARRGVVLVLSLVLTLALGLSSAGAVPGHGKDKAGAANAQTEPGDKADEPKEPEEPIGSPGTIEANASYGYAWPAAPDCDESPAGNGGCVDDGRGFFQGQCTSWVAHRLSQQNGISFTNWYEGRHWGDADQWAKVARDLGYEANESPSAGAVAWYKRGHVAYVESVNMDGSIVISEMNYDGHNGFHLVTLYPGSSWPDKFIHLADLVPVDTTPPTPPTDLQVVSHRGRIGVSWQSATDAWGVAGYRISRSGAPLSTTPADETTYWDQQVSPGQAYSYSVVAYDDAGNESVEATINVGQPAEAADRAWVPTDAGPALCGRTGDADTERLGCTVLTRNGWRFAGLGRDTNWGSLGTRSFVASADGGVAYCRNVGAGTARRGVACTTLDPDTLTWGYDRIAGPTDRTLEDDRTWVSTGEGPALCGRTGSLAHQRVGCTVLTDVGWTFVGLDRDTAWGHPGSRAFVSADDGTVSYCRRIGAGAQLRPSCTPFDPATLTWGYDRISPTPEPTADDNRTWLSTHAGPALCGRTGTERDQRLGCSVLTNAGWTFTGLHRGTAWGDPASRAFVRSGPNGVSYCRTVTRQAGDHAVCTRFSAALGTWGRDRVAGEAERTLAGSRTWQETASGPALCGRTGNDTSQRLGCTVLTQRGWTFSGLGRDTPWGAAGTFVPSDEGGLSYCRSLVPPAKAARVACTEFDAASRVWRRDQVSGPARLTIADPF
jgi:surface antigen